MKLHKYSPCGECMYSGDCDDCEVEILKKLLKTISQQSLSGSDDKSSSPKCNEDCEDVATLDQCLRCTSDKLKRCTKQKGK
jgi:hypothetical protein